MQVIYVSPSIEVIDFPTRHEAITRLNEAARICYKSKVPAAFEDQAQFVRNLVTRGHTAMIEHIHGTFKFVCSRSCANAIVRHRIASYAQESTVYCNYTKGRFSNAIVCIDPAWGAEEFFKADEIAVNALKYSYEVAAATYSTLLESNVRLPLARQVLPLGLKTEVIQTINLRALQNFFSLRVEEFQNPEICYLARKLHLALNGILPEVFDQYLPLHTKTWKE